MFSQLSKGYGSWTAGYVDPYFGEKKAHDHHEFSFPEIDHESHIHGITVGSRSGRSTAMSWATAKRSREPTLDGIPLPKTYTTRKGALQLYVGPDDLEDDDEDDDNDVKEDGYALKPKYVEIKRPNGQELIDLSLKLGTMERLAMSVLQFGDQDYDHEHTSVSDAKNKAFLKFLHKVDEGFETTGIDSNVQPGGDLNNYLRDLKSSASNHSGNMRVSKSRESLELQAILRGLDNNTNWPMSYSQDGGSDRQSVGQFTRPVSRVSSRGPSPGYRYCLLRKRYFLVRPPSTPRSTYQVLSAKKLCASIKSGSYLGRPSSRVSVNDDEILEGDARGHITSASITRPVWTPAESMDDFLTESRDGFYRGEEDTDSDGGKRRGLKERSFLTNNSQLYKGRIARKGEGQRAGEGKVSSKGDGDSLSQRMTQIEEELGESTNIKRQNSENDLSSRSSHSTISEFEHENDNSNWAHNVSRTKLLINYEQDPDEGIHESDRSDIIDVEIDEKDPKEKVEVKVSSRPSSCKSDSSYSGSTSTHTPSIITLQSINSPKKTNASHENFRGLYKRRNTFAYDPTKGLVRNYHGLRRKSENNVHMKKNGNFNTSQHENSQVSQGANRYNKSSGFLHPTWTAYNNDNAHWSVNSDKDSNWPVDNEMPEIDSFAENDHNTKKEFNKISESDSAGLRQHIDDGNVETAVIDQEEYILDNIAACNEEVKQIEEQATGNDSDSDSGSSMDEELIKVILTGQTEKEVLKAENEQEVREEVGIKEIEKEEIDIMEEVEEQTENMDEVVGGTEDSLDTETQGDIEQVKSKEESDKGLEGNGTEEIEEEVEDSGTSITQHADEAELEVVGNEEANVLEDIKQEIKDETVDEENTSDVRSNRSGRKSRSKRSKSGLGSGIGSGIGSEENDDTVSAIEFALPSGTDYTLPSLDSDRLLAKTDGSNKEVQQTINDEQTGFSGSTGSYSDILASNSNSRPATATQSRPASSLKLSRPTSASARPLSATEHERDQDKTVVGGNQDVSKDAEIAVSNKDDNDVALKTGSIQNESETTKTGERNLEKTDTVKQPDKLANNDYLRKPPDIGRNDKDKTFAVEGKDKDDMSKKNHKSGELDAPKLNLKKQSDEKRPQPVPKTGKSNNERKTVGKHITPGRGVPPKLPKPDHKSKQKENEKQKDDNVDVSSKETLDKTVVEGEGLLETVSEHVSKLDKVSGDGNMEADVDVSAVMDGHDITDSIAGSTDAHSIAAELDALGLRKKSKGDLTYPLLPPGKRPKAPAEKAKIPDHIAEALNRQTDASMEYLEQDLERRGFLKDGKVTALVGESLSGPTLEAVGEGLTEEELELAKQILQQKLDEAKGKLDGKPVTKGKAKKPAGKLPKKGAKKPGKGKQVVEEKSPEELDREAIREKHEQEKKIREQEAAELQKKIAEKQRMLKEQNDLTSARSKELQEEMERLEREAEAIQRAEDEAREILADVRKKQREEREARRKADLERKKQEALERREREKKEMEDKRRKEMEMMEKIADAEMRRRMREEEERRIYEEERLAQERYEEELREAQRLEEEEEERLKEMERQAEEEAMQRLIEEREAAERERRRLREEEEALRDAENLRRLAMEVEQSKLEEERRKMQEAEEAKREAERQRLLELRQLEQEARIKMQEEIEKRRTDALARRDYNLENRLHVDKLRHGQGLTRAWTFSYFVHWPRETYESQARRRLTRRDRPIGAGDPRKVVKINNPKPKKADPLPESGEAPQAAVP
ncbi:calponin homology domain-containing protein DDB_G0272472-like isoform X2 [Mercenaria mercenaria]|uniref:calponin homology domain-containing protein DDB_G0272472-like isoform X2 n=1 Tax=Mercenaria mercenaria TaxID=6596 RepID=UPI00234F3054|nr:calponin homology domain-containing protein DDB_G0272472-like isoform X2 [Mercenaria mercenaria]